jgi:GNAT superfamily N-acetyltransferase
MRRITAFLDDVVVLWKRSGFSAAIALVKSRIFSTSDMLLYELRPPSDKPVLPPEWNVTVVCSEDDAAGVDLLVRAGGESQLRYFRRGAVAYVLTIGGNQVARSWYFPNSALARRLGPDAAYFTDMFVQPEWRGQGIQGQLNAYLASLLPTGSRVVMEVVPSNVACQRGLLRGHSVFKGRLHTVVFLGHVIRARIDSSPHDDNPSQ